MNYLEICQRVKSISGIHGSLDTTIGYTGIYKVITELVNDAWMDIQVYRKDWSFMLDSSSFNTVADQRVYPPSSTLINYASGSRMGAYILDKMYLNGDSVEHLPYIKYIDILELSKEQRDGRGEPKIWSCSKDTLDLLIYPYPDKVYEISFYFYKQPITLSYDSDVPALSTQFHEAIVFKALELFAVYIGNQEMYQKYSMDYTRMIGTMMRSYIPHREVTHRGII